MKKLQINLFIVTFISVLMLAGCGAKDENAGEAAGSTTTLQTTGEYQFLADENLEWKDNSLDAWQAVFNIPLKSIEMEDSDAGVTYYFADENGAVSYRNQRIITTDECISTISRMNQSGETLVQNISNESEPEKSLYQILGPIAGGKGYVAYQTDQDKNHNFLKLRFFTLNEEFEIINEIERPTPFNQPVYSIAGDNKGYYHVIRMGVTSECFYTVLAPNGEIVAETSFPNCGDATLSTVEDGRILVCMTDEFAPDSNAAWHILEAFPESGTIKEITTISQKTISLKVGGITQAATPKNEKELVFRGYDGLYYYNAQDETIERIYKWENHGITMDLVRSAHIKEDGTIGIIYKDIDGTRYLLLKPTFEERPVQKVIFAVSPYNKERFRTAITAFNKKYPTYSIELKDNYDNTALLTQLGAGAGPVLIDTELTGFESLQKLWQPLDGFLEQSGLAEALLPEALSFGAIDRSTYGVVTDFAISSLITRNKELKGWDYEAYMNAVESCNGTFVTSPYVFEPTNYDYYFLRNLINGLEDNAYIDRDNETFVFGTPAFQRILKLAKKTNPSVPSEGGKVLREGRAVCESVYVLNVERLVELRMRLEDGETYVVGYPTKNGAKNLLVGAHPVTIRSTATEEEKQIAYTFLQVLLSYDNALVQARNAANSGRFSVRKDILQEQFNFYDERVEDTGTPELNEVKENALFRELLANSVIDKSFPATLQSVFDEETEAYLEGEIPGELLESRLKSRVSLFLDENN